MTVLIHGTGSGGRESPDEQIEIGRIARLQDVGFEPLNGQDPTQLPREIAVFALRQHVMKGLSIRAAYCLRPPGGLRHLLFHRWARETSLDLAERIDVGSRRTRSAAAGRTGRGCAGAAGSTATWDGLTSFAALLDDNSATSF